MIGILETVAFTIFSFIKHADFTGKPFDALSDEVFFSWKDINSNPNPDGIIRMPFRGIYLLTSYLFGPEIGAYSFIASILIFSFIAFYFFCRSFLGQKSILFATIVALMFTFNPIFLGNFSKIGLQMGVACLPLILVFLKKYYASQRFVHILPVPILLIASLVHPFTFIVNSAITAGYAAIKWRSHKLLHVLAIGIVGGLLSAYFVLPQVMMGSVSRSQVESTDTAGEYDSLLNIANTESLFEGVVNAKSVFVDYTFFDPSYSSIFYVSNLLALLVIIGALIYARKTKHRLAVPISILLFVYIVLVLLADLGSDMLRSLIAFLIGLPGGWAFRSPLKWQLYIPLVLYAAYLLSLVVLRRYRRVMITVSLVIFAGFNAHLFVQVYDNLLTPKEFKNFVSFSKEPFDNSRVLYVKNFECGQYLLHARQVSAEIGYILGTRSIQTTTTSPDNLERYDLKHFDYVIDCTNSSLLASQLWITMDAHDTITIYKTGNAVKMANVTSNVYKAKNVHTAKLNDILERLSYGRGVFVDDDNAYEGEIVEVFGDIRQAHFVKDELRVKARFSGVYPQHKLLSGIDLANQSISVNGTAVHIEGQDLAASATASEKQVVSSKEYTVTYKSPKYTFDNMIRNPSFTQGMWKSRVSDCFAFDSRPRIAAKLHTDGHRDAAALELYTLSHLACTEPARPIAVTAGSTYFLSFFTKALQGEQMRYLIAFNDSNETQIEKTHVFEKTGEWEEVVGFIKAPKGATSARLVVYAPPVVQGVSPSRILFDDFFLVATPELKDSIFLMGSKDRVAATHTAQVQKLNPTKYHFSVPVLAGSAEQFLLLREDYHKGWKVMFDQRGVSTNLHSREGGGANIWRVRLGEGCLRNASECPQTLSGYIEFTPQRHYSTGALVSGITLGGIVLFAVYDGMRYRRRAKKSTPAKDISFQDLTPPPHAQLPPARSKRVTKRRLVQ